MGDVGRVRDAGFLHRVAGALHDAADAGLADEHVVRFLGQHEAAGARERIEAGLRQRVQLHLAVAVGEVGEHEERQPVGRRLVERAEHARRIGRAGAAAQQLVRLLAAVAAEIFLQQVHHRPEVTAFLDVDLEQVAHVIERGRGLAEMALLLDRGRLGVALDHHEAAQHGAIFARHVLPGRLAEMLAERDLAVLLLRREQHAPAIVGHLHVIELGPAARIDRIGGAQIDQRLLEALRPHVVPPVDVARMPALQRLEHAAVFGQPDIVRDLGGVIDVDRLHGHVLLLLSSVVRGAAQPPCSRTASRPRLGPWFRARGFGALRSRDDDVTPSSNRNSASARSRSASARPPDRPRSGAGRSSSATRSAARRSSSPSSRGRRSADSPPCR